MSEQINALSDRNLEASTTLSLKREPACFVFLCGNAISPPQPIDAINLDLASVDYFSGRASLWATLEMRSSASDGTSRQSRSSAGETWPPSPGVWSSDSIRTRL